jgi:MFS superfamily sulfate permease-like transporter
VTARWQNRDDSVTVVHQAVNRARNAPAAVALHSAATPRAGTGLSNVRNDVLAGLVVALALIPEAIAFSIIAGVDPKVGLYASFSIATVIAFAGGRPGMISAATGAMALVMVTLVKDHGLQYLLAATLLTGVLQIVAGWFKLGALMRFVSRSVITGFVNALAILIFMAQLPELINVGWQVYAMTAGGLGIIYLFPYVTKAVPSPLVTIVVLTAWPLPSGWTSAPWATWASCPTACRCSCCLMCPAWKRCASSFRVAPRWPWWACWSR